MKYGFLPYILVFIIDCQVDNMIKSVIEIESILKQENKIYQKIYFLEEEKSNAIINRNGKELEMISLKQDELIKEVETLEIQREIEINNYRIDNKIDDLNRDLTLKDIILSMDEDSSHHLLILGIDLKDIVLQISSLQKNNSSLLNDNIEFYNILLSGLKNTRSGGGEYNSRGRENEKSPISLLLNRTV
jgi:flagellar FlgN protein